METSMAVKLLVIISGYLIGSIPTGVWYSKLIHQTDVRNLGSGNSGGTNVGRNFGPKAGIIVTTIDVLKGWLPMSLAILILSGSPLAIMATGIALTLGHAYPLWANFKGGKIVATSIGVLLGYHFIDGVIVGIGLLVIIYLLSVVSISSILAYFLGLILIFAQADHWAYRIGFFLIWCLLIYRHRENLHRLKEGQERELSWGRHYFYRFFNQVK